MNSNELRTQSSNDSLKMSASTRAADDILWEYDCLQSAYQGECEEVLLEMQRIFHEDLKVEATGKEPDSRIETWEDQEEEYLAHAVYEHMQLNDQVQETWCPICKLGKLQENCRLIYCTGCELQLWKDKEKEVNLDSLRVWLADAYTEHFDQGCRLKPRFCSFGLTALYIICQSCNTFEVVI